MQALVITFSNVLIQSQIDLLDVDAIAAFSIYFKIELPIYLAIVAVGQATTTVVAQNRAAGLCERAWQGACICQVLGILAALVLSVSELAAGRLLFWFFGQDREVIEYGMSVVQITFSLYFVYSIFEVQGTIARGASRAFVPAINVFANIFLLRVFLVLALIRDAVSVEAIAFVYPITWVTASLCMLVYVSMLRRSDAVRMAS